eukprot:TRINITY_DN620_c0_g1_i2.p1 TRINITY_DN620_c0_g1~~TRINITY_DN620_c0_g1_i2.p1  ORF type:complete len:397 (-),score=184.24 TRINITY_DN620_c0_g1_i2:256-1446(-)
MSDTESDDSEVESEEEEEEEEESEEEESEDEDEDEEEDDEEEEEDDDDDEEEDDDDEEEEDEEEEDEEEGEDEGVEEKVDGGIQVKGDLRALLASGRRNIHITISIDENGNVTTNVQESKIDTREFLAARRIQCAWRGFLARRLFKRLKNVMRNSKDAQTTLDMQTIEKLLGESSSSSSGQKSIPMQPVASSSADGHRKKDVMDDVDDEISRKYGSGMKWDERDMIHDGEPAVRESLDELYSRSRDGLPEVDPSIAQQSPGYAAERKENKSKRRYEHDYDDDTRELDEAHGTSKSGFKKRADASGDGILPGTSTSVALDHDDEKLIQEAVDILMDSGGGERPMDEFFRKIDYGAHQPLRHHQTVSTKRKDRIQLSSRGKRVYQPKQDMDHDELSDG